jgi:hypothetical protein
VSGYGISVEVDWDRDGDFSDFDEDVTRYIRRSEPVSLSYGRDPGTTGSVVVQGQGGVVLNNSDRRFSSRNTASPLYGLIKPARPVESPAISAARHTPCFVGIPTRRH